MAINAHLQVSKSHCQSPAHLSLVSIVNYTCNYTTTAAAAAAPAAAAFVLNEPLRSLQHG
jgi:hypothetical protein